MSIVKGCIMLLALLAPMFGAFAVVLGGRATQSWRYPVAMCLVLATVPVSIAVAYLLDNLG